MIKQLMLKRLDLLKATFSGISDFIKGREGFKQFS